MNLKQWILVISSAGLVLVAKADDAIVPPMTPAERLNLLTEVRAQLAQLKSERSINAAAIAAAPPGDERKALKERAAEIKKSCERLNARESQLLN